ncbi:MAG: DNA mismatch repair endonuclease MutL [Janthinobacterium lividum]
MKIRVLPTTLINQIAAGEVVERPASAVKELVENAIDAGATKIDVTVREGGRNLILIEDNGIGMSPEDLTLAVERHATSKLPDENLSNIQTLGFRGEALPSIGSVSRMTLTSRQQDAESAWQIFIEGGQKYDVQPASSPVGTRIEIRDLFYATPARLKFLKTSGTEMSYVVEIMHRLAMAHPDISFSLKDDKRVIFSLNALSGLSENNTLVHRIASIVGKDFADNVVEIHAKRDLINIHGYAGIPTFSRANAQHQYLFVNGRPVKDKVLSAALRVAYQDFLARDRYPQVALFVDMPPEDVDINVHPAKTEVRFRDPHLIRNLLISSLKHGLTQAGHRGSTTVAQSTLQSLKPSVSTDISSSSLSFPFMKPASRPHPDYSYAYNAPSPVSPLLAVKENDPFSRVQPFNISQDIEPFSSEKAISDIDPQDFENNDIGFLGHARAQVYDTYIIAESQEKIIVVDQHAAHERLIYEKLKAEALSQGAQSQGLLVPEVVPLSEEDTLLIMKFQQEFSNLGFEIEAFSTQAILVRATPALLGNPSVALLIQDLLDEIYDIGESIDLKGRLEQVCSRIACHNSIRAGRKLSIDEMNAMLRQMESTPYSGQCNHGRPTYVELKKEDIERIFGRR